MANYVEVTLRLNFETRKQRVSFRDTYFTDGVLDFNKVIPLEEGEDPVPKWGTRDNLGDLEEGNEELDAFFVSDTSYTFHNNFRWSPPWGIFDALKKLVDAQQIDSISMSKVDFDNGVANIEEYQKYD